MLRRIRYFQAVVEKGSFSEAAEACFISQSAISQQIQALERELGFELFMRRHKKFSLTPAGEHFYRRTLALVADYDRICEESARLARKGEPALRVGYPRSYGGSEFQRALALFAEKYPEVNVRLECGNHEELYRLLRTEGVDIILNDQRRAFSEEYENLVLGVLTSCVELSSRSPLAAREALEPRELRGEPCILVASSAQRAIEREFYESVIGFRGDFIYAENLEAARLLVIGGKGFLPLEGSGAEGSLGSPVKRVPLVRAGKPITRNYCAFWKRDNSGCYVEAFAELLKAQFLKVNKQGCCTKRA